MNGLGSIDKVRYMKIHKQIFPHLYEWIIKPIWIYFYGQLAAKCNFNITTHISMFFFFILCSYRVYLRVSHFVVSLSHMFSERFDSISSREWKKSRTIWLFFLSNNMRAFLQLSSIWIVNQCVQVCLLYISSNAHNQSVKNDYGWFLLYAVSAVFFLWWWFSSLSIVRRMCFVSMHEDWFHVYRLPHAYETFIVHGKARIASSSLNIVNCFVFFKLWCVASHSNVHIERKERKKWITTRNKHL